MKSIFLLFNVLAISDASECQADENSLLQQHKVVRTAKGSRDAQTLLKNMRAVANTLVEGSDTTMDSDEVNEALAAASQALAELSPAIRQQVQNAQQQVNHAAEAVRACHVGERAELRSSLRETLERRATAVENCHDTLDELQAAETQQCGIAEDCLCDEARTRTADQETLCASLIETYEAAFCEHHQVCNILHECHSDETAVYRSLRGDLEAEMEVIRQEYRAVEQSRCITGLITEAMTPPVTPIPHAALIACSDVDASGIVIAFPDLPGTPGACPAHAHGDPYCAAGQDFDCRLSAYWEYGNCGCGGNDQNQNWCGGIRSGDCPDSIETDICPSGSAHLAEWHPKPYGGNGHRRGHAGHLTRDGCEYIWHAQYACSPPAPPPPPEPDCRLSAYWEYGGCGCGGNDQNQNWCGGIGSGNCPDTVQTNICPSGTAYLAEWHPKPYGGRGHQRGHAGHLRRDGCEYIWHAQYACQED